MSEQMSLEVLLKKARDLCEELRERHIDWPYINHSPLDSLAPQLQGIKNELEFMTRCFNNIKIGECIEVNAREHIALGIGRLIRDLEGIRADMKNKNPNLVRTVYEPSGPSKGISRIAYRTSKFYIATKWRAIEAISKSRRNLRARFKNMTKQLESKIPVSRKGLIRSRLTFSSLSLVGEEHAGSSRSLPALENRGGRDESPRSLRQRSSNPVMADVVVGQNSYDRAWEDAGRRIRLAQQRVTYPNQKPLAEDKPEDTGKGKPVQP
ncbi:hypothetical protein L873DRAFT_731254 [Choiromyces venosus 120613-1]|uniref:Uncharacterized protein n=1 Tax=Choiromyces venosus 120613-1 TaxID=1336337 RepID=A0A3N4K575_9PEZI|nr:hypothetical protein L873DRAFT_731254 [Choiromyces venosus 120613-1]